MSERESTATRATVGASERRPLTVLFADIVGSTAIAERMDPEDWTAIVSQAFARMTSTVTRYDGTIARLMGDGLLAFFGAPVAHEDDPVRAVRCGLDMARAVDELSAELNAKVALFDAMEARPSLARALRDRALVLRALGRTAEADGADSRSREIAQQIGLTDFS